MWDRIPVALKARLHLPTFFWMAQTNNLQRVAGQLMYVDVVVGSCNLLIKKSGTRDSNPRLRPWQIGAQLKTKNNGAHAFHSESMNSMEFSQLRAAVALIDVEVMYTVPRAELWRPMNDFLSDVGRALTVDQCVRYH